MMRWANAAKALPADGEEVLIRREKEINIAVYNEKKGGFVLRNGTICDPAKTEVFWTSILNPGSDPGHSPGF